MVSLTRRTAGCGPACPVVWEGGRATASPIPIGGEKKFRFAMNLKVRRFGWLGLEVGSDSTVGF
jgi:hypothetical protein